MGNESIKKVLNFFVEFDEKPAETPKPSTARPQSIIPAVSTPVQTTPVSLSGSQEQIEKFNQHFNELWDSLNLPGPDYFEFIKLIDEIKTDQPNMDEKALLMSAFYALKPQGLTKEKLIETANIYITKINQEKDNFAIDADRKINETIVSNQNEMNRLTNENEKIRLEIIEKQNLIATNETKINELNTSIQTGQEKVVGKKQLYISMSDQLVNRINNDISKISTTF